MDILTHPRKTHITFRSFWVHEIFSGFFQSQKSMPSIFKMANTGTGSKFVHKKKNDSEDRKIYHSCAVAIEKTAFIWGTYTCRLSRVSKRYKIPQNNHKSPKTKIFKF